MRDYKKLYGDLVDGVWPNILARNASGQEATDGTPYTADILNDLWGFMQALMARAGINPNGEMEKAGASQIADAFYAPGFVKSEMIADANVTAAKIAANAVTTAKIADTSVTAAKINGRLSLDNLPASAKSYLPLVGWSSGQSPLYRQIDYDAIMPGSLRHTEFTASVRFFSGENAYPNYACGCIIVKSQDEMMTLVGTYTGSFIYSETTQTVGTYGGVYTSTSVKSSFIHAASNPVLGLHCKGVFIGRRS